MKIEHLDNLEIPAKYIKISVDNPVGCALFIHGYGGNKEEFLGLGVRISELNYDSFLIDLRGHGEDDRFFDENIINDTDVIINILKQKYKKVLTIGHSLGGRLAITSKADYKICISPALSLEFTEQTRNIINSFRGYRVISKDSTALFEMLKNNLLLNSNDYKNTILIYGGRDIPEIIENCEKLTGSVDDVIRIENTMHGDIILYEELYKVVSKKIYINSTTV